MNAAADDLTGAWRLDPSATSLVFRTKAMRIVPVKGTITATEGVGQIDADGLVTGLVKLDAASVSTGIGMRDKHLRSGDFFDVEQHPTIEFEITEARSQGASTFAVEGMLRLHGEERPVSFDATVTLAGTSATVTGSIPELDRRQWGLTFTRMGASPVNSIEIRATFQRV